MCDSCGAPGHNTGKMMYKCSGCDKTSDMAGDCCGNSMDKVCDCGSGNYEKDCCQAK